jgi:ribosomal protein S18 acetylase RimI-like enzyme
MSNWVKRLVLGSGDTESEVASAVRSYDERRVDSWAELQDILESGEYRSWAFRGQPNALWGLETPLSRYLRWSGVQEKYWKQQEERILRIFRRKAHLHLNKIPDERDSFEWLALMQHHGAPTRLLDFTWSKYVAAFYALSDPRQGYDAAIWALYPPALTANNKEFGPWVYGNFEKYFTQNSKAFVVIGEPHHMNQRLIAHSGTFVVPGNLTMPVEEIVARYVSPDALVKLTLAYQIRREAIKALYDMNITQATLFPDLDGLARSMGFELELHWQYDPVSGEEYKQV